MHLGEGRPVTESLQSLPNGVVGQNIKGAEYDVISSQQLHHLVTEAALRLRRVALHEKHNCALVTIDGKKGLERKRENIVRERVEGF